MGHAPVTAGPRVPHPGRSLPPGGAVLDSADLASPTPMRHLPIRSGLLPAILAGALLVAVVPGPAAAHTPPPVYFSWRLTEERLSMKMVVEEALFSDWFGLAPDAVLGADGRPTGEARRVVQARLDEWCEVRIDRVPVKGILESLQRQTVIDHELDYPYVYVTVVFGVKGRPNQVSLTWRKYDNTLGRYIEPVDAEIGAFGGGAYFEFRAAEPEFTWHAPRAETVREESWTPPVVPPATIAVPVASAALLLAAVIALVLGLRSRLPRRLSFPAAAVGLAAAAALLGVARVEVPSPFGTRFRMPDAREARLIFESLHRNIYRAFDYEAESDIYDTLALSVTGGLLDRVYAEVYESLIMREEGGAVAKVQSVALLDAAVAIPAAGDARHFGVQCLWRVTGEVGHWGHTHRRANEYEAEYTVVSGSEGWRIGDVRVLNQRRVEGEPPEGWTDARSRDEGK